MSHNEENVAFHKSKRANGSLISSARTPQSEDFFTDSLIDASKIPSPSPNKQHASQAYKSRRAIGNTRTLKSAWESAGGSRRSSSGSDVIRLSPRFLKTEIIPNLRRTSTPLRPLHQATTPPPSRSKPEISPTSPSSPPRGLTDIYQQIADEEDLTGQEGELDDEDQFIDQPLPTADYTSEDDMNKDTRFRSGLQRFQSEPPYPEKHEKENGFEENNTVMSDPSGMSFLKELTDENLAAKLTPHTFDRAKDRERLQKLIENPRPVRYNAHQRPANRFGKAWPQDDLAEAGWGLGNHSPTGSITSERSEPLSRPASTRKWGNRAQASKDWVIRNRLKREYAMATSQPETGPESSQVDWATAGADAPIPSIENSITPKANTILDSSPAMLHRQTSLDRIRQWELNDFTGQSLQVSNSPPVRVRTNVADQIRDREIERVEKQAVTTSRLGEFGKRSSEFLRKPPRSPNVASAEMVTTGPEPSTERAKGGKFVKEDTATPDSPDIVLRNFKGSQTGSARPEHTRQQSHDRLRRLARAMSNSPKSSSTPEDWSLVEAGQEEGTTTEPPEVSPTSPEIYRKSSKQVLDLGFTPKAEKMDITAATPVVTGAWTDTILPATAKTTRKQEEQAKYVQTPHVSAGGWIETPLPSKSRSTSVNAPIPLEAVPEELTNGISKNTDHVEFAVPTEFTNESEPLRQSDAPKSALGGLLQRARHKLTSQDVLSTKDHNDTLNLGDATIESLEDLLTLDNEDLTTLIRMGAEQEVREQHIRGDESREMAEAELLERLGGKLERLQTNIHDARKGISKLEHQVSHPQPGLQSVIRQETSLNRPCDACGCPGSGISPANYRIYVSIPFPRLFHPQRKGVSNWIPRPTLLGWTAIVLWVWYFTEQAMCETYCHPLYTDAAYHWPLEPEPVFPFVLPTMLLRWSGLKGLLPALLGPLWTLMVAMVRLVGQVMGWTDGFVDDVVVLPIRAPVGTAGAGLDDLGMMHDEYI